MLNLSVGLVSDIFFERIDWIQMHVLSASQLETRDIRHE